MITSLLTPVSHVVGRIVRRGSAMKSAMAEAGIQKLDILVKNGREITLKVANGSKSNFESASFDLLWWLGLSKKRMPTFNLAKISQQLVQEHLKVIQESLNVRLFHNARTFSNELRILIHGINP